MDPEFLKLNKILQYFGVLFQYTYSKSYSSIYIFAEEDFQLSLRVHCYSTSCKAIPKKSSTTPQGLHTAVLHSHSTTTLKQY